MEAGASHFVHACTHFSLHVFAVHSAYMRAAGSVFAKKPYSRGGWSRALIPAVTSASRLFAIACAKTTLHELAGAAVAMLPVVLVGLNAAENFRSLI